MKTAKGDESLNCREAEKCIEDYIGHQLPIEKQEAFLQHISQCRECREELEINYMVYVGIAGLEEDRLDIYDLPGALERELEVSHQQVQQHRRAQQVNYVLTTLAIVGVILCVGIQIGLWL